MIKNNDGDWGLGIGPNPQLKIKYFILNINEY